ncbi:MAG: adenylate/guanylate cyclase domain-containing protein [Dissulfurispiraceae bacterium]|jgi:adenylate cyclase
MINLSWEDALRQIQEIVTLETGAPLRGEALQQVQNVLVSAIDNAWNVTSSGNYSSREVTILMTDLRGFTSISEVYPAGVVLDLLNRYLSKMSEIVVRNQGTIDKFMGDSIMVLFGAPYLYRDDVKHAITCAVEMQIAMDEINFYHKNLEIPELFMGIGINTGTVMAGLLGSALHSEYTVIGDEVNIASRIEAFSLRGQVLISQGTLDHCQDFVTISKPIDVLVKGKARPIDLYEVLAIPSLGLKLPRKEIRKSPRVEVSIPFKYQLVMDKIVLPQIHQGVIRDISYQGILAEMGKQLVPYSDIKMGLDLSLLGYKATDIYAKILRTQEEKGSFLSGIEFTSVSVQSEVNIKRFVQLLIQGCEIK